jgi:hypothetical protein
MNSAKLADCMLRGVIRIALLFLFFQPLGAAASLEQTFDVLQVGTTTYRNVTVTTKSKNYIFILHSKGMANIKVADLSPDLRSSLGYEVPPAIESKTNSPAAWARQTISKMDTPQISRLREQLVGIWRTVPFTDRLRGVQLDRNFLLIAVGTLAAFYILHCYCCLLICQKVGYQPGVLIWCPFLQLVPLLKAAAMSPWWILGFLVPGLNLVAQVLWSIKITAARRKTLLVALLLIFPLSSPFTALYLAFSGGSPRKKHPSRRLEIMTLEAA